jgi:hypothetical protein
VSKVSAAVLYQDVVASIDLSTPNRRFETCLVSEIKQSDDIV